MNQMGTAGTGVASEEGPLRVLIVDDQQLVRSGFSLILSIEEDIAVVGQAADGAEALRLARLHRPDVVLMDVQMPVMDGIAATESIVGEELAKVLILTTFDRDDYLFDALQAGASGFLLKNSDPAQLVDAVRAVGHGHALLAPEVTMRVIGQMVRRRGEFRPGRGVRPVLDVGNDTGLDSPARVARVDLLTERECEVLRLMAKGLSNGEIAKELFLGEATIKTHVSNCLAKLRVRDRVQAVVVAYESGLISPMS